MIFIYATAIDGKIMELRLLRVAMVVESRLDFDFCGCNEVPSSSFSRINYQSDSKYINNIPTLLLISFYCN